jgi:hypothetical protein
LVNNKNRKVLLGLLKSHPTGESFINLTNYLEFQIETIKDKLMRVTDEDDIKRLQGRGLELTELLLDLRRIPVAPQATGAFDTI